MLFCAFLGASPRISWVSWIPLQRHPCVKGMPSVACRSFFAPLFSLCKPDTRSAALLLPCFTGFFFGGAVRRTAEQEL